MDANQTGAAFGVFGNDEANLLLDGLAPAAEQSGPLATGSLIDEADGQGDGSAAYGNISDFGALLAGSMAAAGESDAPVAAASFADAPLPTGIDVDLSTYVMIGRYDLPEPTRTDGEPTGNLLAQEASGVTYNWDTNTLFIVGDGAKSVTEVTLTGELVSTMTLASGTSPQGTEFYDVESITYVGGGQFVFTEERWRQAVKFTYAADTTLTRAATQTVDLGTDIGNVGLEGLTYDPESGGFIFVKEKDALGLFQTTIDFDGGTASNGSSTTVNSTNLFDPALLGLSDLSDVYAFSSNSAFVGTSQQGTLLILSQEAGKVVEIDRSGNILSTLILAAPTTSTGISLAAMTVEGMTMDADGRLYLVSEEGGGDFDHPQLWVFASATGTNEAPTDLDLSNALTSILENTNTASRVKVADVVLTDDGLGTNSYSVTGADAAYFEADSSGLYIKSGVSLDYETKTSYSVTVEVDDASVGSTPDASVAYTLAVTNVVNESADGTVIVSEVAPWSSGNSTLGSDWFEITNSGSSAVDLTGWKVDDNSASFASGIALTGVSSIGAGESVIFIEVSGGQTAAGQIAAFKSLWFGGSVPAGIQIGTYSGSGIGLGAGGDAVNIYNGSGLLQASVSFGSSPSAAPFATFDNGLGASGAIATLSATGTRGAFVAAGSANEVGSPGTVGGVPAPVNHAPTAIGLTSEITSWAENTSTAARVKVAGVVVTDDDLGTNHLAVTGADAAYFEVDETGLYIKAGVSLDYETKASYSVTVTVDDTTLGSTPDASVSFNMVLTDVNEPVIRITEIAPWSSGNSPVGADWFEITNMGTTAVDLTGWKMDDSSAAFGSAVALNGITTIAAGETVIFLESSSATIAASFLANWFGGYAPAGLQVGTYTGAGVGLSTGGDGVVLFDASGAVQAAVAFGSSPSAAPYATFDNAAGLNGVVLSTLSSNGVAGAFTAWTSLKEIGSPGQLANAAPGLTGVQATLAHGTEDAAYVVTKNDLTAGFTDADGHGLSIVGLKASNGTVVDNGDGTYTIRPAYDFHGTMSLTYGVTDSHGGLVGANQSYTVDAVYDAPSITGVSSSAAPFIQALEPNAHVTAILTTGDTLGSSAGLFGGVPDGIGAFDNGDGTITVLVNHEITNAQGIVRDHGSAGSYIDRIVIDKATLQVVSGDDAMQTVHMWDDATDSYLTGTAAFSRFCSGDLADPTAFYDATTGLGTTARIYLTGEESGAEGRAVGTVLTGSNAGHAYELPYLGNLSFENLTANPFAQTKTIVAATDDGINGQVYIYVGDKQAAGTDIQKAGLASGTLYGIKVAGIADEANGTIVTGNFSLEAISDASNKTGAQIDADSEAAGVTSFLRPEDSAWDPDNPNTLYFTTTNSITGPSRLYKAVFADIAHPELGGTIEAVLDGTEGQKMFDNLTVANGKVILQEDPGNNAYVARVWEYDIASDTLTPMLSFNPALFTSGLPGFITQDEESSGILDVTHLLGGGHSRAYLLDAQVHAATGNPATVEQGQLLLVTVDDPTTAGTNGNDLLQGSAAAETFTGLDGNDTIQAGSGHDIITAGNGDDRIEAGAGDDRIYVGVGAGYDAIDGGAGTDAILATANGTRIGLSSVAGIESISANGFARVAIFGSADNDVLDFSATTLTGITSINGGSGNDSITGSAGADMIVGGTGSDLLAGGAGNDSFLISAYNGFDSIDGGADFDTILAGSDDVRIRLTSLTGVEAISANGYDHVVISGDGDDNVLDLSAMTLTGIEAISGGSGNDAVTGSAGNDVIEGGLGADVLKGGDGDDVFLVGRLTNFDDVDGGAGADSILATTNGARIGLTAFSHVETISGNSFSGVTISGSTGNDVLDFSTVTLSDIDLISGHSGDDQIIGSAGADVVAGGNGADLLTGGAGNDRFVYNSYFESRTGIRADHIADFTTGDQIDLRAVDANINAGGLQSFTFVGSAAFTDVGQLRIGTVDGHVALLGNVGGSLGADFSIVLNNDHALVGADLLLI